MISRRLPPWLKKKIEIDTILQLAEQKFDASVLLILKKSIQVDTHKEKGICLCKSYNFENLS